MIPLCKPGIAIGSIFVITIVMGDFVTIGVMGGQQLASIGKIIQVETSYLQFPAAAANAVILLVVVLMIMASISMPISVLPAMPVRRRAPRRMICHHILPFARWVM